MGAVPKINIVRFVFCLEYGLTFIDSKKMTHLKLVAHTSQSPRTSAVKEMVAGCYILWWQFLDLIWHKKSRLIFIIMFTTSTELVWVLLR